MKSPYLNKLVILCFALVFVLMPATLFAQVQPPSEEDAQKAHCPKPYIKLVKPKLAKPGDVVVIRGHRFGNDTGEVRFNKDIPGAIILWRNQRIEALVPEGATTGFIKVIKPCLAESNGEYIKIIKKQETE